MRNRLRELRAKYDLTQQELAEAVRCSRTSLGLIETGRQIPSGDLVLRLQAFFPGEAVFFAEGEQYTIHDYLKKRSESHADGPKD